MTRTLDILDKLIGFPTVSSESNLALIDFVQDLLVSAGIQATRIPSPCGTKAGLFARIGPETSGGVCLSGHTDVVPTTGQNWTRPEFQMTQDASRIYGRGTTDMKGFVASALALAERAAQTPLSKPLTICLSYDEEVGCTGIRDMLPSLTPLIGAPDIVIVGEPTAMGVAIGHKGKAALTATCYGEAGHSALAPQFTNAIHVASAFVTELRALQARLAAGASDPAYDIPYSTVHIGRINGGRALNIVPDLVTLDFEFRHLADVPADDLLSALQTSASTASAPFGDTGAIEISQTNAYPPLDTAADNPAIVFAQRVTNTNSTHKVAFGTEAGYFANLGLSSVVIGPGDMARDGHKPDEGLDLAQLAQCDAMMARILADLGP